MLRLNLILFAMLIVTALATVTAQHKSRKLYVELQQQQDAANQYLSLIHISSPRDRSLSRMPSSA